MPIVKRFFSSLTAFYIKKKKNCHPVIAKLLIPDQKYVNVCSSIGPEEGESALLTTQSKAA